MPVSQTRPDCAVPQALLDRSGAGLTNGDFDAFEACVGLPHTVVTFDATNRLETQADLRGFFDDIRGFFAANRIDRIVRICTAAQMKSSDLIESTHETYFFNGARQVIDPIGALTNVQLIDETWKFTSTQYAFLKVPDFSLALSGAGRRVNLDNKD